MNVFTPIGNTIVNNKVSSRYIFQVVVGNQIGGVEHHIISLIRAVSSINSEFVILCGKEQLLFFKNQIPEVQTFSIGKNHFENMIKFHKLHKQFNPQIVHCHLYPAMRIIAPLARFLNTHRIYETIHIEENWRKGWKHLITKADSIIRKNFLHHSFAVSNAVRDFAIIQGGLREETTSTLYNFPDISFDFERKTWQNRTCVLGFMGRLTSQKSIHTILKACSHLDSTQDYQLIIAGEGELKEELVNLRNSLNLNHNVSFIGKVNKVDFFKKIDCLLLTSIYEGMPLVLLEAGQSKCPVISTPISGNKEVLGPNGGLFIEVNNPKQLAEKINFIIANPIKSLKMGQQLFERIQEKFSREIFRNTLKAHYYWSSK